MSRAIKDYNAVNWNELFVYDSCGSNWTAMERRQANWKMDEN